MDTLTRLRGVLLPLTQQERRELGERAGVPFETVQKIAIGVTENPRIGTVEKLLAVLPAETQR